MKKDAIAERPKNTAIERPAFIQEGKQGHEGIDRSDLKPPALRLAQSGSKEVKRSEEGRYIEGLAEGELFITPRTIVGEGPIDFLVIAPLGHRHVEFDPDNLGTVLDMNVPDGDPRTQFHDVEKDGQRTRVKPRATKFIDFLVLLTVDGVRQWATLSFKSTGLKTASEILGELAKFPKLPTYAHQFRGTPVPERRGQYSFYGLRVDRVGFAQSEDDYKQAAEYYESFAAVRKAGGSVVIDRDEESSSREPGEDDM